MSLYLHRNPKISSEEMKRRMQDYKMVQIKSLVSRKKAGSNIDGNWVTIGVLVDKLPPRWDARTIVQWAEQADSLGIASQDWVIKLNPRPQPPPPPKINVRLTFVTFW